MHCSQTHKFHFSTTFSLKMDPTVLFTNLKIILLQCFSVFNFSFQFLTVSKRTYNLKLKSKPSKLKTLRNPRLLPLDLLPFCFSHVGSPSHLLTVESSRPFCFLRVPSPSPLSNVSLSIFFNSLLTVYKYWQQLNVSIQVSLNPNLFSALFFLLDCLMFFIPFLNFVTTYCLLSVVMWLRLVHVVYAK